MARHFKDRIIEGDCIAEMKKLDGTVILEEPDPHSGMRYFYDKNLKSRINTATLQGQNIERRLQHMDQLGIDIHILTIPAPGADRFAPDDAVKIARVANDIPATEAKKAIDAKGLIVTPGLIDLHAHVFGYSGSILPDDSALYAGTTTVVDAGGAGWMTFDEFKKTIIDHAQTRVLSLINIVGHGMVSKWESNTDDMDPVKTAAKMAEYPDLIVGIKTAHFGGEGWTAIDAQNKKTTIKLDNQRYNVAVSESAFSYAEPKKRSR